MMAIVEGRRVEAVDGSFSGTVTAITRGLLSGSNQCLVSPDDSREYADGRWIEEKDLRVLDSEPMFAKEA